MAACDKCWQGRHLRCGGRAGCSCTVCSPTSRSVNARRNHDPKAAYKQRFNRQKASGMAEPTVTADDVRIAINVLGQIPEILDHVRVSSGMAFERIASDLQVAPSMIRGVVAGRSPQGMTTKSLLAVLPFAAEHLPRASTIT